jgi:hypothetical protein
MKSILKNTVISLALLIVVSTSASAQTTAQTNMTSQNDSLAQTNQPANTSIFAKNQIIDKEGIEIYSTNLEMKAHKKIGVGVSTGGMIGGFGINGEFNLEPQNALFVGFGRGEAYNSFNLGWKYNFESEYLSLYTKVGYSKWFNNTNGANSATSNDILKRVLTDSEVRENKFSTDFFAGGAGLEYNQLEGELSGVNFFGEILIMSEIKRSIYLPTASVGVTYFY